MQPGKLSTGTLLEQPRWAGVDGRTLDGVGKISHPPFGIQRCNCLAESSLHGEQGNQHPSESPKSPTSGSPHGGPLLPNPSPTELAEVPGFLQTLVLGGWECSGQAKLLRL